MAADQQTVLKSVITIVAEVAHNQSVSLLIIMARFLVQ